MGAYPARTMALDVRVDRVRCIGSGVCTRIAPSVFELDDDGIAVVIDPEGDGRAAVVAAAETCPTDAILVFDGGRRIR